MVRRILAVLVALAVLTQDAAFAEQQRPPLKQNQVEITWDELAGVIVQKRISTVLPDGVKLQGEVLAVRPDSLLLYVQKSSQKKLHALGQTEIPRASISEVRVIRHSSPVMRIIGGTLGAIGGVFATGVVAVTTESAAAVVLCLLLLIPLSAVAGYYAGKAADRRTTRITIAPDVRAAGAVRP
jgi:hypothetical protein